MYEPDEMGRTARQNNFEAMSLMKDAKRFTASMRKALYQVLKLSITDEARDLILAALEDSDRAVTAADAAVHWLFENEIIYAANAKRGKYKKVKE